MGTDIHGVIARPLTDNKARILEVVNLSRDYDSFAVLGNVRNARGWAGTKTGEGFNYISSRRGLPPWYAGNHSYVQSLFSEDDEAEPWLGDHSFSHFAVKEFLDFDWTQKAICQGFVDSAEYAALMQRRQILPTARPSTFSGGHGGKTVTEPEMKHAIATNYRHLDNLFCLVQWEISYYLTCTMAWNELMPLLLKYAAGDYENTYFIFGFDS